MTLEYEIVSPDGLRRDVWDFRLRIDYGVIVLRLDRTLVGERPSKRHKFQMRRTWERARDLVAPLIPDDVRAAIGDELIARLRTAVEGAT